MTTNLRKASRDHEWSCSDRATIEQINAGSLQRIADATETMSRRYTELIRDRDRFERYWREERERRERADRRISALRGVITKLQRRLEASP